MPTRAQDPGGNEPGPRSPARALRPHPGPDLFAAAELGAQAAWTVVAPWTPPIGTGPVGTRCVVGPPAEPGEHSRARGAQVGCPFPGLPPPTLLRVRASPSRLCWPPPPSHGVAAACLLRVSGQRGAGVRVREGPRASWLWRAPLAPPRGRLPQRPRAAHGGVAGSQRELLTCEHGTWGLHGPALCSTRQRKHAMSFSVFSNHRLSFLFRCKKASPSDVIERNAFTGDLL